MPKKKKGTIAAKAAPAIIKAGMGKRRAARISSLDLGSGGFTKINVAGKRRIKQIGKLMERL